jgi:hypothetical protein
MVSTSACKDAVSWLSMSEFTFSASRARAWTSAWALAGHDCVSSFLAVAAVAVPSARTSGEVMVSLAVIAFGDRFPAAETY